MSGADSQTWHSAEEIVAGALTRSNGGLTVINPPADVLRALARSDAHEDTTVIADGRTSKRTFDDFIAASAAAESIRDGTLSVHTVDDLSHAPVLAGEEFYATATPVGSGVYATVTTDDSAVAGVAESIESVADQSEPSEFRTPPRDEVMETLGESAGEDLREDFTDVIEEFERLSPDQSGIDVVETLLLLAARNEILLYEVSKWGEDIELASKATFSRAKSRLEERDLIDTVKVPIDVGRPRLRLLLPDDITGDEPIELIREATTRFDR